MLSEALGAYSPMPTTARICITAIDKTLDKLEYRNRICAEHSLIHNPEAAHQIDLFLDRANQIKRVEAKRFPLHLSAYYMKHSRNVSQTPMIVVDGANGRKRIGVGSVEEFIANPILHHFYNPDVLEQAPSKQRIFLAGAGREDVDVRTLGEGRQFILTVENPNRNDTPSAELLQQLERDIALQSNGLVTVFGFKLATEQDKKNVLHSAEFRRKRYQLAVQVDRPVVSEESLDVLRNMEMPLVVHQQTPIRVAHRRAMMVRDRKVLSMQCAMVSNTMFILNLEAGAGFYIKEFCFGDFGRTEPSVSDLMQASARCVALDFMGCTQVDEDATEEVEEEGD